MQKILKIKIRRKNCVRTTNPNTWNFWIFLTNLESCSQFHQHYTRAFFVRIFSQSQIITRKSCQSNVRTKNLYVKCWWNWHLVIFETSLLRSQYCKYRSQCHQHFTSSFLCANTQKCLIFASFMCLQFGLIIFWQKVNGAKATRPGEIDTRTP